MKIGNSEIEKLYIGEDEVDKLYLGTDLIYEESTPVDNNIYIMFDGAKHLMTQSNGRYQYGDNETSISEFSIYKGNTLLYNRDDFSFWNDEICDLEGPCGSNIISSIEEIAPSGETLITSNSVVNGFNYVDIEVYNDSYGFAALTTEDYYRECFCTDCGQCDDGEGGCVPCEEPCPEEPCEEGFIWDTGSCSCMPIE